jgi:hypothetical protein
MSHKNEVSAALLIDILPRYAAGRALQKLYCTKPRATSRVYGESSTLAELRIVELRAGDPDATAIAARNWLSAGRTGSDQRAFSIETLSFAASERCPRHASSQPVANQRTRGTAFVCGGGAMMLMMYQS